MAILPLAALKGVTIPAWGNTPGKDYIFPKSPERAIKKCMSCPFRADWLWDIKIPVGCFGLII